MMLGKDLGLADSFVLVRTPTLEITKSVYKGRFKKLGEEVVTRVYDERGRCVEEAHVYNGRKGHISINREITSSNHKAE